jgi:2,4-dienoyl-CoA reductase (NADPH2)
MSSSDQPMAAHERFRFNSLEALREKASALGLDIRFETRIEALRTPIRVGSAVLPNRLAIHPMEGCDGTPDGSPDVLTIRRYERFARSGAGLVWFEATAVVHEGRANPRQLWLHPENVGAFAELVSRMRRIAEQEFGQSFRQIIVCQLTHSGRYSKPDGRPKPVIAQHDPFLDTHSRIPPDYPLITDGELERLEDAFVRAARLAKDAGFDGVDIKSCHRYLISELLAAHTREGLYGGSYENRTRFLKNVVAKIRHELGSSLLVTPRLNAFDGIPFPYGFGQDTSGTNTPDPSEPKRLVRELFDMGVPMVNITVGNPYYNPHLGRPFDTPVANGYIPNEHPLEGVARLFHLAREIQQHVPQMVVVGTGYSWLRQFLGYAAEANVRNGWVSVVGVGREAFAYPSFARDLLERGELDPQQVCITCSSCSQIMRDGGTTGCVPRDRSVYQPVLQEGRRRHKNEAKKPLWIGEHF